MFTAHYIRTMILCMLVAPLLHAGTGSQTWSLLTDYRKQAIQKAELPESEISTPDRNLYRKITQELSDYYAGITDCTQPGSSSKVVYSIGKNIIHREREHANTHFFLYHSMSIADYIALRINTYLDHCINGTPLSSDFLKLRAEQNLYDDIHGLPLDLYCRSNCINDHYDPYRTHLLATSLAFLTAHEEGESAIFFFRNNKIQNVFENALDKVLSRYHIENYTAAKLRIIFNETLNKCNTSQGGTVLQIGIPKEEINTCTYLSHQLGKPRYIGLSTYDILNLHQNNIQQLSTYLEDFAQTPYLQARMRLNRSQFSQPGRIKMFIHHGLSQELHDELYYRVCEALADTEQKRLEVEKEKILKHIENIGPPNEEQDKLI